MYWRLSGATRTIKPLWPMFTKIVVLLSDLPEAQRALRTAIALACASNGEISTVSILGDLPIYASFAFIGDPAGPREITENHRHSHDELHNSAAKLAGDYGIHAAGTVIEGRAQEAIPRFLKEVNADLLVIALHRSSSHILWIWDAVHSLAPRVSCSVLSVH